MANCRIDMHTHYFPSAPVEAFERRNIPPRICTEDGTRLLTYGPGITYRLGYAASSLETKLAAMDELGISLSILGVNVPGLDWLDAAEAPAVARAVYDELAELTRANPDRFAAVAALPMQVPHAAEEELRRSTEIGLRGAMIYSNVVGAPVDDAALRPVFAAAEEVDVPIVLHPTYPLSAASLGGDPLITTVGFLFDTTTCALRLILDGV
ncbi:MAG: amidohydrolase family protein [Actinomycetia bacterium]|nr:amidohydrolase family protein [Actinomycetes bacterium]